MLFGPNPLERLRQRMSAVIGVFALSAGCCGCGALMAFVLAPGQALEASRISGLPPMDRSAVEAAAAGDDVLITGILADNPPLIEGLDLVAYTEEAWEVTEPSGDDDGASQPRGTWTSERTVVPALSLELDGQLLDIHPAPNARLSGGLHEEIIAGDGVSEAAYEGEFLPEGSLRYRGLANGDLTTVLGRKGSTGGVVPEQLYAGDRVAFEESQRQAASGLLFSGICSMALAPLVLVGGLLAALLWRR